MDQPGYSRCRYDAAFIVVLTMGLVNCARPGAASPYDLFIVSEAEFFDRTQRIALVPLYVDVDLDVPDTIVSMLDSLVENETTVAGFDVIPSLVYDELWRRIVEDVGGVFDPYTGRRDDERFESAVAQLRRELVERYQPHALLAPELWIVEADFRDARATWDGATQNIAESIFRRGVDGVVLAITLGIIIEDLDGAELYVNGGGIEVMETLEGPVPPEALFRDAGRIEHAVRTALQPLRRRSSEASHER